MRVALRRLGAGGLLAALWSCTFGSLAEYDIKTCDPGHQDQAEDECDILNAGDSTTCQPWRCDVASQRCERGTRDDDRDGNPPAVCGGTDCDDHDPFNAGRSEVCDGRDNNCNGLADDGIPYTGTPPAQVLATSPRVGVSPDPTVLSDAAGIIGTIVATSTVGANCIDVFALDSGGSTPLGPNGASCSFLSDNTTLSPVQASARRMAGNALGVSTVFASTSGCPNGALGYRWYTQPAKSDSGFFDLPCPSGTGLPGVGTAFPVIQDLGSDVAVILFYDVSVADRGANVVTDRCTTLKPAPLIAMPIGYGARTQGPLIALPAGIATAPIGTVALPAGGALAAIPIDATGAASLYFVPSSGAPTELAPLPDFKSARALAVSLGSTDALGRTTIAVVGELGCAPQRVVLAFGTLTMSGSAPSLAMTPAQEVIAASQGDRAIRPVAVWQPNLTIGQGTYAEWLVTWTDATPASMARRFDPTGKSLSEPFKVGAGVVFPVPAPDGRIFGVSTSNAFEQIAMKCP